MYLKNKNEHGLLYSIKNPMAKGKNKTNQLVDFILDNLLVNI